jgi:hypothetical protein
MVARTIPRYKRVGLHYIGNPNTRTENKGLIPMSDRKHPSRAGFVTNLG